MDVKKQWLILRIENHHCFLLKKLIEKLGIYCDYDASPRSLLPKCI